MDIKDKDIEELIKNITEDRKKDFFQKKDISAFRNNQKNFQYDYEEDFYEPRDFYED